MFSNYLSRPNVKQPILTQYCDGERVTCPNWLSQWGSKYLGDQNYSTIENVINLQYHNRLKYQYRPLMPWQVSAEIILT